MTERQSSKGVPALNSYYMYLTGGCNLACKHCWLAPTFQPHGDTGGHLDYKLFELAIEEGLPLGLRHVKLTGGEPLLHPDFIRMVDLLREKELGLTIESNAVLMTEKLARYLKEKSSLRQISISLDGANPETHDSFRGVRGSFDKTCQAIRYLVDVGIHPQVIMSIHEGNVDEIEPLVRLAENLGVGSVKFNLINSTGRAEMMVHRGQVLGVGRLIEIGKWVETYLQQTVKTTLFYSWPIAFHSLSRLRTDGGVSCSIFNILGILNNGNIAMCGIGTHIPDLVYGKLGKESVEDVWYNNAVLKALREDIPNKLEGVCSDCIFRDRCFSYCVADNYHTHKRITAPFWFCEQSSEAGLFPHSRQRSFPKRSSLQYGQEAVQKTRSS
jgi:SynChlorMet cassette radical SAM/SPASM protein ScmF